MEISPEDRRKIYEEEKAVIEAEEKSKREQQDAGGTSTTNLEPNVAGLLCYVGFWITGIIFLILEQKSKFVRFHAIQSVIVFGALGIAGAVLNPIPLVGWFFSAILGVLTLILWIVLMVKAHQGELFKVPLAGDLAAKFASVSANEFKKDTSIRKEREPSQYVAAAKPSDYGKQVGDKATELLKNTSGRVTSSSFAIAWSFILVIFFNFFNEYIAYYEFDEGWTRYQILTQDFNAWLPILTIALAFSIAGHIILIVYDRYVLRETTLVVLNVFGIAVVLTLLALFPFDFSGIPHTTFADIAPVIITVVLIAIAIGLFIGTLVSFVKLVVNIVRRASEY